MERTPDTSTILHDDCLTALAEMPDASVDSIVTDPPYLIDFMGKGWDSADGIAGQPEVWRECLRVLKPGGHLLAFGATRTYHRMSVAIEDAGFEIRDSIHWTYGSGFPKSLDVSKSIDKAAGAERQVVGSKRGVRGADGTGHENAMPGKATGVKQVATDVPITAPATPEAQQWQGWGTALKPSHEPIVVARKPLDGTVAQNVLAHGTGALNIDGTRVGTEERFNPACRVESGTPSIGGGWTATEGRPAKGRWPANTVLTHAAGCQATGETVEDTGGGTHCSNRDDDGKCVGHKNAGRSTSGETFHGPDTSGGSVTVTAYVCVPGCPVAQLDQQSGISKSQQRTGTRSGKSSERSVAFAGQNNVEMGHTDAGGASRFFTTTEWTDLDDIAPFLYVAKPSKKERNAGLDGLPEKATGDAASSVSNKRCKKCGLVKFAQPHCICAEPEWEATATGAHQNFHPTVKPVALMRHLIRLVTPPGGVVLDPFTGSGTTGVAAILEGTRFIGIEMTDEYLPIIEARLAHAIEHTADNHTPVTRDRYGDDPTLPFP